MNRALKRLTNGLGNGTNRNSESAIGSAAPVVSRTRLGDIVSSESKPRNDQSHRTHSERVWLHSSQK